MRPMNSQCPIQHRWGNAGGTTATRVQSAPRRNRSQAWLVKDNTPRQPDRNILPKQILQGQDWRKPSSSGGNRRAGARFFANAPGPHCSRTRDNREIRSRKSLGGRVKMIGPRAVLGSQQPRTREERQIYASPPVHSNALRAEDGSRSGGGINTNP